MNNFLKVLSVVLVCAVILVSSSFMFVSVFKQSGNTADVLPVNAVENEENNENTAVPSGETVNTVQTDNTETETVKTADTDTSPVSASSDDVSKWTKEQIASFYVNAVNNTKARKGDFSADHVRVLKASVTKCTGGSVVTKIVDKIVQGQLENTNETLNFVNGTAKRSDGNNVTLALLPPQNTVCSLSADSMVEASAKKDGENTVIEFVLKSEEGTYENPPVINAPAVGYFDFNSLNLNSNIKITGGQVQYPKSSITVTVGKDNTLISEDLLVPIVITMQGSVVGITGELVIEGDCVETWNFK